MGTPKQELWIDRYAHRLDADVLWSVGALFDYLAGRVPRAPRWLADNGLEWIFRLAIEPHRMWRRYLLGNPAFLARVLSEARRERAADNGTAPAADQ
jgi:N-acetylglucosaminyldiphosphoundecaprenol N-acetyl-beta-D-mannosaminyltransferase